MENLLRKVNINKKVLMAVIIVNILIISLYYSYALVEVNSIRSNNVEVSSDSIDFHFTSSVSGNMFTLESGKSKIVNINLSTSEADEIRYKLYYIKNGTSKVIVNSNDYFNNNIVEGVMTNYKTITLTFKNTGSSSVVISLGAHATSLSKSIVLEDYENEIVITR